jgi:hypothetical protein
MLAVGAELRPQLHDRAVVLHDTALDEHVHWSYEGYDGWRAEKASLAAESPDDR